MRGIFVTGTDTNIGKTFVSAILASWLREKESVCYWKPIQTGIEVDDDTKAVRELANLSDDEICDNGFRLLNPLSPHISAKFANVEITVENTLNFVDTENQNKFWIVEGAGGVLVPLNDAELMIDLMRALELPVVIVARSGLGTINHTLLTIEILRNRGLQILGVIMNGEHNNDNKSAIEHFGKTDVILEIPKLEEVNSEQIFRLKLLSSRIYEQLGRA